ncbi:hypothetical protein T492DRAFT_499091 [Pavlovales sp. CCMP2436]|nr:hypothetical protein T492DRAFT_499091 [Pavlovales sp. CCMP2436]
MCVVMWRTPWPWNALGSVSVNLKLPARNLFPSLALGVELLGDACRAALDRPSTERAEKAFRLCALVGAALGNARPRGFRHRFLEDGNVFSRLSVLAAPDVSRLASEASWLTLDGTEGVIALICLGRLVCEMEQTSPFRYVENDAVSVTVHQVRDVLGSTENSQIRLRATAAEHSFTA